MVSAAKGLLSHRNDERSNHLQAVGVLHFIGLLPHKPCWFSGRNLPVTNVIGINQTPGPICILCLAHKNEKDLR